MSEKEDKEMVELLWGITDKLDRLLAAIEKVCASVAGSAGKAIDTGEPR